MIQWYGRSGPEAEVSAWFTPSEWWALGPDGVIHEQQQVYLNALHAIEPYLPARFQRQAEIKTTRVKEDQYEAAFALGCQAYNVTSANR